MIDTIGVRHFLKTKQKHDNNKFSCFLHYDLDLAQAFFDLFISKVDFMG